MIRIDYFCFACCLGWTRFTTKQPDGVPRCRFRGCSDVTEFRA